MAYTRINWKDLPSTATPRNATNLNVMDKGLFNQDARLTTAEGEIDTLQTDLETAETNITNNSPIGVICLWSTNTAPTGYLICDGTAISRTTYAKLFSVIGTSYGAGDNSTTFNLPNLKGKVPVGRDSTQTEFNSLGKTGGEKAHILTIDEMPSHNHTFKDYWGICRDHPVDTRCVGTTGSDHSYNTNDTGGNQAHNNMQPYIVLNYIIKAT